MSDKRHLTESEKWLESRGYKIVTTIEACAKKGLKWKGGKAYDRTMPDYSKTVVDSFNLPHTDQEIEKTNELYRNKGREILAAMSDNDKYYTPDISEFHVGFEYEYRKADTTREWTKTTIGTPLHIATAFYVYNGERVTDIRVKKLDHEDIIKCGWKMTEEVESDWTVFGVEPRTHKQLYLHLKNGETVIGDRDSIKFEGVIANISELKRIMKQIGI